jgi:hypothetical protein
MLSVATERVSRHAARGRQAYTVPMAVKHLIFALSLPAFVAVVTEAAMDITAGKSFQLLPTPRLIEYEPEIRKGTAN